MRREFGEELLHRHFTPKELKRMPDLHRCVQEPGDIVIVPQQWIHATFDASSWTVGLGSQAFSTATKAEFAASAGDVSALKKTKVTSSLLRIAAESGYTEVVEFLLRKKAISMDEALLQAARQGHVEVTKALLDHKADVAAREESPQRSIPLSYASMLGRTDCVSTLLERRSDISWKNADNSASLLHLSASFGHAEVSSRLIKEGLSVHAKSDGGRRPIHEAADQGHVVLVKLLLAARADPDAEDDYGQTIFDGADRSGHVRIIDFLQSLIDSNSEEL